MHESGHLIRRLFLLKTIFIRRLLAFGLDVDSVTWSMVIKNRKYQIKSPNRNEKKIKWKKKKSKSIRYEMSLTFGIAVILRGTTAFRSISLRSELRSPWRLRNSEFRSRVNGFESVKSNIEGASARPTWNQIEKNIIQSQIELRSAGKWTQFRSN